ncbi:cytochrome P450 2J6-like [Tetranychus urticae]|uniref:Cytochrome P450 n=1 Tax=Tetranychus urticae TaxID=32264 RepID=T1KTH0_TETUR|nr:cytochrome P450 2J6-like [Tetranychus urticae]
MFLISLLSNNFISSKLIYNISTGLIAFWCVTYLIPTIKRLLTLPPGPWGLPIVGYLPFLEKNNEYKVLDRLAKKYGPVYSLNLGKDTAVIVNDWNHAKEVFKNDELLARPGRFAKNKFGVSIVEMSGEPWRVHRQNTVHLLRDLGLGKSSFDDKIIEEIQQFLPKLEKGPVKNVFKTFLSTATNTISILLLGHGFEDDDDPVKQTLVDALMITSQSGSQFSFFSSGLHPKINRLLMKPTELTNEEAKMFESTRALPKYMQNEIDQHKKKQSKEFDDYIDGYLEEQKKRKNNDSNGNVPFDEETLRSNVVAFYVAGSETVSTTLTWAILYLIKYPEYYEKIRAEISDVIGFERLPDYSDRNQMPMTMSFIYEVHRAATIVPANLFRAASRDLKIGNFNVPKDSTVILNFWTINRDPSLYIKPDEFDPSRFLTDNGTKAVKPQFLTPFSKGKRGCPGEGFANIEIFLYLVSIVQRYKIECEPGSILSFEADYTTIRRPKSIPPLIFTKVSEKN